MGKILTIKGHESRGNEIIELLKMLGGKTRRTTVVDGSDADYYYTIIDGGYIDGIFYADKRLNFDIYTFFTLEDFLKENPFKIGDLVDRNIDYVSCIIDDMRWNSEKCCVEYHLNYLNGSEYGWHVSDCLIKPENVDVIIGTKIKSTGFMQMGKTVSVIFNSENYEDEVELQLGDYEIEVRDGKTYAVKKKPVYPKTYVECCNILHITSSTNLCFADCQSTEVDYLYSNKTLLNNLNKLIICRDAYWKIYVEEMGLGKTWKADWKNTKKVKYGIALYDDIISKMYLRNENVILAFPTEEMRDVFYENFKDLIEQCKELL